jgi:predicted ATPase
LAHIRHVSVSGLGSFRAAHQFDLDRHVNVFFGLNGSGKTSLLKILDSAMTGDAWPLAFVPFESAEVQIYSETYDRVFTRSVNRADILEGWRRLSASQERANYLPARTAVSSRRSELVFPWTERVPLPDGASARWAHIFLPISRMFQFDRQRPFPENPEEFLNESFEESVRNVWRAYIQGINAAVRTAQSTGLANILNDVLQYGIASNPVRELDAEQAYDRVRSFLSRQGALRVLPSRDAFLKKYEDEKQLRTVVSDIDEVERQIEQIMAPRKKLQSLIEKMFSGRKSIRFEDDGIRVEVEDSTVVSLGMLSSGEKQVLRLLIESLRANESSLIIDEPELSMHVDWQRELVASMNALNPDSQLILATHSPEVMADVDDERIFRL